MVIAIAPLLASEGVLGGLRGEMRRIEDKFVDSGLECKMIQVPFDLSQLHGNRTGGSGGSFQKKRGKQLQLFLLSSRLLKEFSCTSSWMDDRFGKYLRCKTRYPLQGTSFRQTVHWLIPTCFARTTCGHTLGVGPLHHSSQATWTKTVKHVVFVCLRPIGPMFTLYVVL